jgi:hypothetical protein
MVMSVIMIMIVEQSLESHHIFDLSSGDESVGND